MVVAGWVLQLSRARSVVASGWKECSRPPGKIRHRVHRALAACCLGREQAQPGGQRRAFSSLQQRVPGRGWRTIALRPPGQAGPGQTSPLAVITERSERPRLEEWLLQTLLPKGWPQSVTDNYLAYAGWTSLGLLSGRIQSVLGTQAALFAIGLGAGAIPMAAAVQWVMKDGIGHACAVVYSTAINTRFDADAKRYRFQATIASTVADFIAIVMPLYPGHFMALASLSSATNSMATVALLASRARIQASFALQGNLADCARAGQTQAKLMGLLGTALGAGLSWVIGPNPLAVGACMVPLALVSLWSMYASSRIVVLSSLNLQRTERVFKQILQQLKLEVADGCSEAAFRTPTPADVAEEETFAWGRHPELFERGLVLQPLICCEPRSWRLPFMAEEVGASLALPLLGPAAASGHAAAWHGGGAYALAAGPPPEPVLLWHREGATARAKLQAVWHACLLRHCLPAAAAPLEGGRRLEELHALAHSLWPQVLQSMELAGWEVDRVFLDGSGGCLEPLEA